MTIRRAGVVAAAVVAFAAPPAAAAKYPRVEQLVAFRDGTAIQKPATVKAVKLKVGGRTCAVGAATPLAALVRIDPPKLRVRDYGSCSDRARDAGSLFVRGIGPDVNKGIDGWVYKVGRRLGTAGAADPTGPFGNGRLKDGQTVTWFYCRLDESAHSCQRTLEVKPKQSGPGQVTVRVRAYDDHAKSIPAAGATVRAGDVAATADGDGVAVLSLPAGHHEVRAERAGDVRSFDAGVDVG